MPDPTDALEAPPAKSSRASTTDTATLAGAIVGVIATGVGLISLALHAWRTPGDDNDVWLAAEDELHDISAPLSRIVARKLPAGLANGDVGDGVAVATATAAYTARNLVGEVSYKRAGGAPMPTPAVVDDEPPASPPMPAGEWPPNGVNPLEHMGRG